MKECSDCNGTGLAECCECGNEVDCDTCEGTGELEDEDEE